jgi:hypothetical protein
MEIDFRIYTPNGYKRWFLKIFNNRLNRTIISGGKVPFTKAEFYVDFSGFHLFALKFNRYEFCITVFSLTLVIVRNYAIKLHSMEGF